VMGDEYLEYLERRIDEIWRAQDKMADVIEIIVKRILQIEETLDLIDDENIKAFRAVRGDNDQ
jgi:hypothetical protein